MENSKYIWPSDAEFVKELNFLGKLFYYSGAGRFTGSIKYYASTGFEKWFVLRWWHPVVWIYALLSALLMIVSGVFLAIGTFFKELNKSSLIHLQGNLKKNKENC